MRIKILVVDDEEALCDILKYNLELDGYEVDYALSGEEALTLDLPSYSLFILDIMMGEMSGFDLARRLKHNAETENTPVIFCSALDGTDDTVMGLNLGGDDYITKPFVVNEVLARVRAVLRRSQAAKTYEYNVSQGIHEPDITFKTLRVNRNEKTCFIDGKPIDLTKTEFEILLFFLTHRDRIYSREQILNEVWPGNTVVTNRTVDTNIARLRKRIDPYGNNIVTKLGYGYGFKEAN